MVFIYDESPQSGSLSNNMADRPPAPVRNLVNSRLREISFYF